MDDKKYCIRREWRDGFCIWELDRNNVSTGKAYYGLRNRYNGLIDVYTKKYGKKMFSADIRAFVPLERVVCLWESQVHAIQRDRDDGNIRFSGEPLPSMEKRRGDTSIRGEGMEHAVGVKFSDKADTAIQDFTDLFDDDKIPPVKLGNDNKTGECGMCGIKVDKLYPRRVGDIDFMICSRCKAIMDM